jgi:hypothetical protein
MRGIIGLVILTIGVCLVVLSLTNIIKNIENHAIDWWQDKDDYGSPLKAVQLQSKECLLFENSLDSGDEFLLEMRVAKPHIERIDQIEVRGVCYTLDIYVKDSLNNTLKDAEYESCSLENSGERGHHRIDFFFQAPKRDTYKIFVAYKGWMERRPAFSNESWVFHSTSEELVLPLKAYPDILRAPPNLVFVAGGLVLVAAGIFLSSVWVRARAGFTHVRN